MASKKYTMMLGLLGLISTAAFAQDTTSTKAMDNSMSKTGTSISAGTNADDSWIYDGTNRVRASQDAQQTGFLNHTNAYPAKPKSMWELGIGVGPSFLLGPIDPRFGYGASISLRKSLSHIFSIRAQYGASMNYGQDFQTRSIGEAALGNDPNGVEAKVIAKGGKYLANYKTFLQTGSADLIADLNAISNYRGNEKTSWYVLAGYTFGWADVAENLLDNGGAAYDWSGLPTGSRKDIRNYADNMFHAGQSNKILDTKGNNDFGRQYETAVDGNSRSNAVGGVPPVTRHGLDVGMGVAFKVSPRFNIGLEQKFTFFFGNSDMLVGLNNRVNKQTTLSSTQVRFNFNLGNSSKRVEPLNWVNPNNYIYNKLATRDVLPDADGDGVTDQFDLEPNTPAGCAVDTHGRSLDTDGDGVPDCRDKQVLTPQSWFPVDADGVGTEPEPACCAALRDSLANMHVAPTCSIANLPSVRFNKSSVKLDDAAQAALVSAAAQLNANPTCKVKIVGYGASNKRAQQLSWDRVNAVKNFLIEKQGISEGRIIFTYGYDGDANTVDLQSTTEEGPSTVPAPHPNLQRS